MPHFDPYHQWLGIPPSEQPPDHYRLLGIRQLEDDQDVIENAADRQMAHLKTFQTGPRSADSQRLLNEVSAARICLLNPAKKNAYDQQLCQVMPAAGSPQHEIKLNTASPRNRKGRRKSSRNRNLSTVAALVGVMIVAFAIIATLVVAGRSRPTVPEQAGSVADTDPDAQTSTELSTPDNSNNTSNPPSMADFPPGSIITQSADSKSGTKADTNTSLPNLTDNTPTDSKKDLIIEQPASPVDLDGMVEDWMIQGKDIAGKDDAGKDVAGKDDAKTADPDSDGADSDQNPEDDKKPTPEKPKLKPDLKSKLSVPSLAQQKKIAKRMEEAYDFSAAKTPSAQKQLARQLLRDGLASRGSDGEAYVLLNRSAELSVIAGDASLMFKAIDAVSDRYEIDAAEINLKLLKRFVAAAKTPATLIAFRKVCQDRIDAHLAAERYQAALDTAKLVYQSTARVRNKDFRKLMLAWQQALTKLQKDHQAFEQAKQKLADTPENANAALVVGRWYCFGREDYAQGLPFLAKGSDSALAAVAQRELKFVSKGQTQTAGDAVDLGNVWWDMAEKAKGVDAAHYRLRALHWYMQAKPRLTGLEKATVNKRIDSFMHIVYKPPSSKSLAGLLARIDVDKSGSGRLQKRQPIVWRAYVICNNAFEMCVNGKNVFSGNKVAVLYQRKFEMAQGDIITVRVKNTGGPRGFCCVIRSENGSILATGPAWRCYEPKDPSDWANPIRADKITPALSANATEGKKVVQATGINAKTIWGRDEISYLMLKVQ